MLHTLKLLLPALIPSWRFFDIIAPSPRIQFRLLKTSLDNENLDNWEEFRPRPTKLNFLQMLKRMLWNPIWSESLYLVSCAEQLVEHQTSHSESEILKRILYTLKNHQPIKSTHLQFRLLMIKREGENLKKEIVFHSRIQPIDQLDIR